MHRHICSIAACLLVTACQISVPEGVLSCASERDCPLSWACSQGTCVQALQRAAAGSSELFDAGRQEPRVVVVTPERDPGVRVVVRDASTPRVDAAADSGARVTTSSTPAQPAQDLDDAGSSTVDASTQPECHVDYIDVGAECGGQCDTPGTIQCDGHCSKPDPADYGDECGHCGGHIQCDGSCDFPDPPRYGELCSDLLSSVGCTGSCECVRQCPNGQLVPCARLCPILCRDGFCEPPFVP